jgi:predicted dehydrogenase
MTLKMAFAGFRHGHILSLYELAQQWDGVEVVASCEEDAETRAQLQAQGKVKITHDEVGRMLDEVECDALAVGDYFARRGSLVIEALLHGRHAIADKPLCTRLSEIAEIERLTREKGLKVGCMLTMRDSPQMNGARALIQAGRIGAIHAIAFGGQHPLLLDSRPSWYFEPGKHGGTITDIGIHAIDAIPWITGLEFETINAARCWNAFVPQHPHFEDAAQMMLTMDNGCGVLGDVSYFAPDRLGYRMPLYWRTTFWGREGVLELAAPVAALTVIEARSAKVQHEPLPLVPKGGYLRSFLDDIAGKKPESGLDTEAVLGSMKSAIEIQEAADHGAREVRLSGLSS